MWRDIGRLAGKLLVLVLPFFMLLPLYCKFFPMYYMDEEYAMYKQQDDYVSGKLNSEDESPNRVLILGDSRAKAGFSPAHLWDGSYNLSLGGATPIEGYYSLKKYLSHHEKPQTVILSYAPMHYMDVDTLWTRSIYFHTLSEQDFKDLTTRANQFQDIENILIEDFQLEYLMYKYYLPNKYATALKKSAFVLRHDRTTEKYDAMVEFKGHSYYGTADQSGDINGEAKVSDFVASDIITWYLQETLNLCLEQGIDVIVEQTPMNETSYGILTDDFKHHYRAHMQEIAERNSQVVIYPDFYCYPNDCFGDADHLNSKGVEVFDAFLMEKYPDL